MTRSRHHIGDDRRPRHRGAVALTGGGIAVAADDPGGVVLFGHTAEDGASGFVAREVVAADTGAGESHADGRVETPVEVALTTTRQDAAGEVEETGITFEGPGKARAEEIFGRLKKQVPPEVLKHIERIEKRGLVITTVNDLPPNDPRRKGFPVNDGKPPELRYIPFVHTYTGRGGRRRIKQFIVFDPVSEEVVNVSEDEDRLRPGS